ncbi:MAG: flavin reductase family protein [Bacteroidota bacterium]
MNQTAVDKEVFKAGMSQLAGAVNIVTTSGIAGKGGFTATAVCAVTDSPPTLLVCINNQNELAMVIKENKVFAVNILSANMEQLANRFAGMDGVSMEERLSIGDWRNLTTGSPTLQESIACFDCELINSVISGTHSVLFGKIVDAKVNLGDNPLLYYNRNYGTIEISD